MNAMSFFTSAMTSGPMPSPGRRRSLWVAIGHCLARVMSRRIAKATADALARRGPVGKVRVARATCMSPQRPKVVIVGAGFGGIEAATALSRVAVDVIVLDRQNHHCFQPLLYQVATAALSPAEVAWPIRHMLRQQRNATVFMAEVEAVDLAGAHRRDQRGSDSIRLSRRSPPARRIPTSVMTNGPSSRRDSSASRTRLAFAEAFCWRSSKPNSPAMMPSGSACSPSSSSAAARPEWRWRRHSRDRAPDPGQGFSPHRPAQCSHHLARGRAADHADLA